MFDEDVLMRNAQFLIDQVSNIDAANEKDGSVDGEGQLLITTPAMRSIIRLSGATPGKRYASDHVDRDLIPLK